MKTARIFNLTLACSLAVIVSFAGCTPRTVTSTLTTSTGTEVITTVTRAEPVTLNVSAASSLTDALTEINRLYTTQKPWVTISPNFNSSGTIQQQIENGAPCDVFISAAAAQMDSLQARELIWDITRRNILMNRLVLAVPIGSTLGIKSFSDLANPGVKRIAVGDPASVPAGTYARDTFDLLKITAAVEPKLVLGGNVRQVLAYVESGDVDAGVVFYTDEMISTKVLAAAFAPDEINAKITYPVAIIKASLHTVAAQDYENYLSSDEAKLVFEKYGFRAV